MGLFSKKSEKPAEPAVIGANGRYDSTPAQREEYARLRAQGVPPVAARKAALQVKK